MTRLKCPVQLQYIGSSEYTNKKGETRILYKFRDYENHEIGCVLPTELTVEPGTLCNCVLDCGQYWIDAEKRYRDYYRIISAVPAKTK